MNTQRHISRHPVFAQQAHKTNIAITNAKDENLPRKSASLVFKTGWIINCTHCKNARMEGSKV
jgi:hypothetical protein